MNNLRFTENLKSAVIGNTVERYGFDAWGRRRNPVTLSYDNVTSHFDRGFTMHEHYDDFGLINMNGRMYDPLVGRMLSPDIVIQDEHNPQAYNRYAYCLNNPLKYTDPNGELFLIDDIIIGAFVGAFIGGSVNATLQNLAGNANVACTFGIGALAGIAGVFAGGAAVGLLPEMTSGFYAGAVMGAASGAAGGFIGGAGTAWCGSASFGDGLMTGLKNAGVGAVIGGTIGGVSRGLQAYTKGFSFWNGCKTIDFCAPKGIPINEAYPNLRNFSAYDMIEAEETASLQRRIALNYNIGEGQMGLHSITTKAPKDFVVDPQTGLLVGKNGEQILGQTLACDKGFSDVYISPYAATHSDEVIFRAVAGHELTHAYHYYHFATNTVPELLTERVALDYSYMEYYNAGYTDLMSTIPSCHLLYPPPYRVPTEYSFSTINFYIEYLKIH